MEIEERDTPRIVSCHLGGMKRIGNRRIICLTFVRNPGRQDDIPFDLDTEVPPIEPTTHS